MERGFQSPLLSGKYGVGDGDFSHFPTSDEIYIGKEMSSQARSYEKSVLSSLNYPYGPLYDILAGNIQSTKKCESSTEYRNWRCDMMEEKLKRLKYEHSTASFSFNQLPELRSIDELKQEERRLIQKFSPIETITNRHTLESMLSNFQLAANCFTPTPLQPLRAPIPPPEKLSSKEREYRRRHTLSEKTRSLQKLLPVDKKMEIATIYEETYNYIQFLQAQISALESMPVSSCSSNFRSENPRYGGLGELNRQQLLEILVNSPAIQSILYSKGCCIYSLEQLMLFTSDH